MKKILLIFFAVLLSGCSAPAAPDIWRSVEKYEDRAEGVVCYVYRGYGISCVGKDN